MIGRVLKIAVIVLIVYALMHSPGDAAHNVRVAGKAALDLLGTLAERMVTFFEALFR